MSWEERYSLVRARLRRLGFREELEDVAQEVMMRAYRHLEGHADAEVRRRLMQVCRSVAVDVWRRRARRVEEWSNQEPFVFDRPSPAPSPERELAARDRLALALASCRWPLDLLAWAYGMNGEEVELATGTNGSTSRGRAWRSRKEAAA